MKEEQQQSDPLRLLGDIVKFIRGLVMHIPIFSQRELSEKQK
jgi:hypothetical protein